ncbi:MAG: DinB family protein, partial [Gemmatimonadaceae bacterium]|nr:DinB family protein [Gemmatimonadaceae bacterium]
HILAAEHVWLARIEGRSGSVPVWPVLALEECEEMAAENAGEFAQMLSRETEASLQREVTYTNSAAQVFTGRVLDVLTHVALHGAYHRGQVALLMRRGGGTPAPTDFIAFVRGAAAATREASPTK